MSYRVEANCGFALWRLWSRGAQSVRLVCGFLPFARHGSCLPLFPKSARFIFVVKQFMDLHHYEILMAIPGSASKI
jgi:hypothetical protein